MESSTKLSIRNSIFSGLVLNLVMNISLYIGQLLIARTLPRNEYATFLVITNFVVLFSLFADLGLTPLFVRMFAASYEKIKEDAGRLLGTMLFVRLLTSVMVSIAVVVASSLLGYTSQEKYLMVVFLSSLLISSRLLVIRSVGEALLRSKGKYYLAVLFATIDAFFFASVVFIGGYYRLNVELTVYIYTFCNLPGFIMLAGWVVKWLREEKIRLRIDTSVLKSIIKEGIPLALGTAFLTIHNTADTLLLDRLSTATDVSAYGAGMRVLSALIFLPGVFALVVAPEIVQKVGAKDIVSARRLVARSLEMLMIVSFFLAVLLSAAPSLIIIALFGSDKFIDAAPLISLFAWTFVGMSFSYFMIEVAIAEGKQWISMLYMLILMTVSVTLDLLLIEPYGFLGAGIAKLTAVVVASVIVLFTSKHLLSFDLVAFVKYIIRIGVLSILISGVMLFLHHNNVNDLFSLALGVVFFSLGLHFFRIMKYNEVRDIIASIRPRARS